MSGKRELPESVGKVYSRFYNCKSGQEEMMILKHPNGVSVLCLGPKHPVLALNKQVSAVNLDEKKSRAPDGGKRKKWAIKVNVNDSLGKIVCADGSEYNIPGAFPGKLLGVNERLGKEPHLVNESPNFFGHLAVIQVWWRELQKKVEAKELYSQTDYDHEILGITPPEPKMESQDAKMDTEVALP